MGLRLGIDLDGVVADFNEGWISHYNSSFHAELTPDMVQFWDGLHTLTHFKDMDAFWEWAKDHGGHTMFRHLQTYTAAVPTMRLLRADGHHIAIITAKPWWSHHDTYAWIADNALPTTEVHIIDEKWRVPVDIYLDDSPHVVPSLVKHRPESVVCRFVRPWNDPVPGAVDVHSWDEFAAVVAETAEERGGESQVGLA